MVEYESSTPLFWELIDLSRYNLLHLLFLLFWRQLRILLFLTRYDLKWVYPHNRESVLHRTHHKLLDPHKSLRKLKLAHKVGFPVLLELKAEKGASSRPDEEVLLSHWNTLKLHFFLREEFLLQDLNRGNFIVNLHLSLGDRLRFGTQGVILWSQIVAVDS